MARRALRDLHPKQTLLVPLALVLSTALLFIGLSLPLLYSQKMFWKSTYSVWAGVVALWQQNELALAAILFFFSIVFPIVKLIGLATIWFLRLPDEHRAVLLHWLGVLGKWSMLDVFVVAILIVLVKLGPFVKIEPRLGVYVFAAAIAASMLTTMYVERLAKQSVRSR
ncbi:MAG: paraquat-inducible protein A [Candidatus Omnitrophica bacterium]|nr:paraquat-inducible protein A [Candidatus Omnitrophota bacterium]